MVVHDKYNEDHVPTLQALMAKNRGSSYTEILATLSIRKEKRLVSSQSFIDDKVMRIASFFRVWQIAQ